jgi:malate synthase
VPIAKQIFDEHMQTANQIGKKREEVSVTARDLLTVPHGDITEQGLRWNIDVGLQYIDAWLRGLGCVPIYNLMEDAATAEICRAQVWQWIKHGVKLSDGRIVTQEFAQQVCREQVEILQRQFGPDRFVLAADLFQQMLNTANFPEFLTLVAYNYID